MSERSHTVATAWQGIQPISQLVLQRACACGQHSHGEGECAECQKKRAGTLQRTAAGPAANVAPPIIHDVLRAPGQPLDAATRGFMEPRFGHDFSRVQVHTDVQASKSARAVNALAYTVGSHIAFDSGQYAPCSSEGRRLIAHELTHVLQQGDSIQARSALEVGSETSAEERNADHVADAVLAGHPTALIAAAAPAIQRRAAPYIKKITVHLTPPQTAELAWEGTPPADALGTDSFTVSTGKGYSDIGDPAGTCTRTCCNDPLTQCAPPWNQPGRVGACCTYYGNNFWTGTPLDEHNGWQWWTPIQPFYGSRGIALHQHTEVTGEPIGHGCVRMDGPNAKRIYDYSNGQRTNVTIDGRAAPVACAEGRRCRTSADTSGGQGTLESDEPSTQLAQSTQAIPGLEGELS
jgi:hypothetical protein